MLADPSDLIAYISSGTPPSPPRRELEAVYSFLAARLSAGVEMQDIAGLALTPEHAVSVADAVRSSLTGVTLPAAVIARHAGLSPVAMQRLLDRMADERPENLLLAPPEQPQAWRSYEKAFRLLVETMGADFGVPRRQRQLAVLVVMWMQGRPLARLVDNRLEYQATLPKPQPVATTIRGVMEDVESVARFLAPKYLACYLDVLRQHLAAVGQLDLLAVMPDDIEMLLELGVSTTTEVSLLSLGLSRTSAVELFAHIVDDDLTPVECLAWLAERDLGRLGVPELVRREVTQVLAVPRRG